jgi:hypothetical protein
MANFRYSPMPLSERDRQAIALAKLMQERKEMSKRTGTWPTDEELEANRKKNKKK